MNDLAKEITKNLLNADPEIDARIERGIEENRKGFGEIRLVDHEGKPVAQADVQLKHIRHEFHFGGNSFLLGQFKEADKNVAHDEAFKKLFNLAVVPFYWSDLEPEDGQPRFAKDSPNIYRRPAPDLVLDFCEKNNIVPKGHPLCWHLFIPTWLPKDQRNHAARLERRIEEIAARYRNRIRIWDVCNEALACPPGLMPDRHVELSFEIASRCFPRSTVLTYNDFVCWDDLRGDYTPFYMLGRHLKNLPEVNLGALGLQYHMFRRGEQMREWARTKLNVRHLLACLDQYGKVGVPLNVSEISIGSNEDFGDGWTFQREVAEKLYRLWFSHPMVNGVIYWNLIDNTAYVPAGVDPSLGENQFMGGLLDKNLAPKPAYTALERLINKEWRTDVNLDYQAGNINRFRGFYGDYELTIKTKNGVVKKQILLSNKSSNVFEIKV